MTTIERKLATVRQIAALAPIPDADRIEVATIDGWKVVVKKGEFQIGDACVYFEIDSFLPESDPRFDFMMKDGIVWNGKHGARLRTVKLRGQVSQGLALPADLFFSEIMQVATTGASLSDVLGIEKWERPIAASLAGQVRGSFPSFLQKTDQERIQNMPWVLHEYSDDKFEVTVKLDGSSMTIFHRDGYVGVCSRNLELVEAPGNTLWSLAHQDNLVETLKAYETNIAIQGEVIGPSIQGNSEKLDRPEFHIFDVYDIDNAKYLSPEMRYEVLNDLYKLGSKHKHVPILDPIHLHEFDSLDEVLAFAEGPSLNPNTKREGVVFKGMTTRLSFKAISNSYLLKNQDR